MVEFNYLKHLTYIYIYIYIYICLSKFNDQQFRLNKISRIKDYFIAQIRKENQQAKCLANVLLLLTIFDNSLIALSATSGSIFIESFVTFIGAPLDTSTGIANILLKATRNKKKKHNNIIMLPRNKLNSI